MSSSLSALEQIDMLSAFSLNRGEQMWVQDILDGWEDKGYARLTPLLNRPLPPFPGLEAFLLTEESDASPRPIMGQHTPFPANITQGSTRPIAPSHPPHLPRPRHGVNANSFTLTPVPQGGVLRGLAPPEEPKTLKGKLKAAANIIGRPFTKAEVNWVMATLWPDSVDYLGKGNKSRGQANTVSQYISTMKRSGDFVLYQSAFVIGWFWWIPNRVHHCSPGHLFYEASPKDAQDE